MSTPYNSKIDFDSSFIKNHYLGVENGQLVSREKHYTCLGRGLLGKLIHWICYPNERLSQVRDQFEKMIKANVDDLKTPAEMANCLEHVQAFNERVITPHNSSWISSLFFWNRVSVLPLDLLTKKCSDRLSSLSKEINQRPINDPQADTLRFFDAAQKELEQMADFRRIPEFEKTLNQTEQLLEQKKNAYKAMCDGATIRLSQQTKFSKEDFTLLDALLSASLSQKPEAAQQISAWQQKLQEYATVVQELTASSKEPSEFQDKVTELLAAVYISDEKKDNLQLLFMSHRIKRCQMADLDSLEADCTDLEKKLLPAKPQFAEPIRTLKEQLIQLRKIQACAEKLETFQTSTSYTKEFNECDNEFLKARRACKLLWETPLVQKAYGREREIRFTIDRRIKSFNEWMKYFEELREKNSRFTYRERYESDIDGKLYDVFRCPYIYRGEYDFYNPWEPFGALETIPESRTKYLNEFFQEFPESFEKTKVLVAKQAFEDQLQKISTLSASVSKAREIYNTNRVKKVTEQCIQQLDGIVNAFGTQTYYEYLEKVVAFYKQELQMKIQREKVHKIWPANNKIY